MTDLSAEYIRWLLDAAIQTCSLIVWHERDGGVQPVLFPNEPFRWLDDDATALYETAEGYGRGDGDSHIH